MKTKLNQNKNSGNIRDEILSAAMRILQTQGVKKLSQAKVAKEAGIRQSHLTYYFPKKIDLTIGLLQQHIDGASIHLNAILDDNSHDDMETALSMLATNRARMRFFLGLIVEADGNDELRTMLRKHILQFDLLVAHNFGRPENDPDVAAYLCCLRGLGMTNMVQHESSGPIDVKEIALKFGLQFK